MHNPVISELQLFFQVDDWNEFHFHFQLDGDESQFHFNLKPKVEVSASRFLWITNMKWWEQISFNTVLMAVKSPLSITQFLPFNSITLS